MSHKPVDDSQSPHPKVEVSGATLAREHPLDWAMYLVRSNSEKTLTVFALADCYVDELIEEPKVKKGQLVFGLNAFEIKRETFKLEEERALLSVTEQRLEKSYLEQLIFRPLDASKNLAESDRNAAVQELEAIREEVAVGEATKIDEDRALARLAEMEVAFRKANIDRIQKDIEIEAELRRLDADRLDLEERLRLNGLIANIYEYFAQIGGTVEYHTFKGAFVEKGDPICTIRM